MNREKPDGGGHTEGLESSLSQYMKGRERESVLLVPPYQTYNIIESQSQSQSLPFLNIQSVAALLYFVEQLQHN